MRPLAASLHVMSLLPLQQDRLVHPAPDTGTAWRPMPKAFNGQVEVPHLTDTEEHRVVQDRIGWIALRVDDRRKIVL